MVLSISNSMYNIMMQYTISIASPPFTGVATALLVGIPVKKIIPAKRILSINKERLEIFSSLSCIIFIQRNYLSLFYITPPKLVKPFLFYLSKIVLLRNGKIAGSIKAAGNPERKISCFSGFPEVPAFFLKYAGQGSGPNAGKKHCKFRYRASP